MKVNPYGQGVVVSASCAVGHALSDSWEIPRMAERMESTLISLRLQVRYWP